MASTSSMTFPFRSKTKPYSTKWLLGLQETTRDPSLDVLAGRNTLAATSTAVGPDSRTMPTAAEPPPMEVTIAAIVPQPGDASFLPASSDPKRSSSVRIRVLPRTKKTGKRLDLQAEEEGELRRSGKPVVESEETRVLEWVIRDLGEEKSLGSLGFRRFGRRDLVLVRRNGVRKRRKRARAIRSFWIWVREDSGSERIHRGFGVRKGQVNPFDMTSRTEMRRRGYLCGRCELQDWRNLT